MILQQLSIFNFKNIQAATLSFSPKINCLIGDNGVGKTNLLDAIYYLSFCRSAFTTMDSSLITHGQDFFVVEGDYVTEQESHEQIYCGMKRGVKKQVKRNKKTYKRLSEHIGLIPIVFVSPSDSQLIDGGSEERRRLMDTVIAQYDSSYIDALATYNKALQQRNVLLKQEEEPDEALMDVLELQMARSGELIYEKREAFVREMIPVFQEVYHHISQEREQVTLTYVSHCQRGPLLDIIRRDRMKDRVVGYSLHGIHRDDLEMMLGGYPVKREGSQGQNKTFVLALKFAQFRFLQRTISRTTPILLLDDIFDKLDASRVEQIVQLVAGNDYGQIFITDTNRDHLDLILRRGNIPHRIFIVDSGDIKVES